METTNTQSSAMPKVLGIILGILVCCSCVAIVAAGALVFPLFRETGTSLPPFETSVPAPTVEVERPPTDSVPTETLETLAQTVVPENDPYELACRLKAICNVPTTVPSKTYQVGDQETFWVTDTDTAENFEATATLRYITPHVYFWIENGVNFDEREVQRLGDAFESEIYPTNREFFGTEWTPGVDNDPHIYILYVGGTGASNAGYYSNPDQYNPLVKENANGHEMFVFNADTVNLGAEEAYSVLAHEFQHMIHWYTDKNEDTWMNEGFSVVAQLLNNYSTNFENYYIQSPDINLTDWSPDPGTNGAHYGGAFLYLAYFLDRFGEDATKELVKNSENGLISIDETLQTLNITDPLTGNPITADDVFMDWAATMHLMDESVGDGRFHYGNYPNAPKIETTEFITRCPGSADGSVNQYGIDYFTIDCAGDYTLSFNGSTVIGLLPADANSGKYAFWSNKGDDSNMTLTREFDFTNASGPITLAFAMWYDLETDYDYLFLEASTDGETWEILTTPSGTDEDPSGNSYGWGYNGQTDGWVAEEVDLSQFAGQKVQIRFEYITDAAVNGQGFLLDDVRIDAINYQEDFETNDGGWEGAGFVRVENVLPQTYRLTLITQGDTPTVIHIPLEPDQTAEIPLSLRSGEEAVLIVTGTTRFTRLPAGYQIEIK